VRGSNGTHNEQGLLLCQQKGTCEEKNNSEKNSHTSLFNSTTRGLKYSIKIRAGNSQGYPVVRFTWQVVGYVPIFPHATEAGVF
jgi:hypothetical protein